MLRGAYLIYDNEERSLYYDHRNDYNGGGEFYPIMLPAADLYWKLKEEGMRLPLFTGN